MISAVAITCALLLPLALDFVVFAAKRHDAHLAFFPGQLGDAVAVQSGAVDQQVGLEIAGRRPHEPAVRLRLKMRDSGRVTTRPPDPEIFSANTPHTFE